MRTDTEKRLWAYALNTTSLLVIYLHEYLVNRTSRIKIVCFCVIYYFLIIDTFIVEFLRDLYVIFVSWYKTIYLTP